MNWLNNLLKPIFSAAVMVFGGLILAFTSWRTLDLFGLVIPGEVLVQWLGLVLFDGGLLMWTLLFIHNAGGIPQRAAALVGLLLDLALVIVAVSVDLLIGGQTLVQAGEWANLLALVTVVIAVAGNLIIFLAYHLAAPSTIRAIQERVRTDEYDETMREEEEQVRALALRRFREMRQGVAGQMAEGMAGSMLAKMQDGLGTQTRSNPEIPVASAAPAANGTHPKAGRRD